ncbi:hypothetical protein [Polluticaenibacter yanchengensis]|uniref:Uncharacterized protein n=1 Tax=Polluticaenibacter yanchengensis TaxID=3014562 RepID=A0ABT4UHR4_9BACT|nr:hypothetical protein [Chitinophagaceae bacterium LY-5]
MKLNLKSAVVVLSLIFQSFLVIAQDKLPAEKYKELKKNETLNKNSISKIGERYIDISNTIFKADNIDSVNTYSPAELNRYNSNTPITFVTRKKNYEIITLPEFIKNKRLLITKLPKVIASENVLIDDIKVENIQDLKIEDNPSISVKYDIRKSVITYKIYTN